MDPFRKPVSFEYDVPTPVPVITQPTDNECWAACAAMILCWRDRQSYSIGRAMDLLGTKYRQMLDTNDYPEPSEADALRGLMGVTAEPPANYSPNDFLKMLKNYGPLWVLIYAEEDPDGDEWWTHGNIVTGIIKDGESVSLKLIDPGLSDGRNEITESFQEFNQKFARVASRMSREKPLMLQVFHLH